MILKWDEWKGIKQLLLDFFLNSELYQGRLQGLWERRLRVVVAEDSSIPWSRVIVILWYHRSIMITLVVANRRRQAYSPILYHSLCDQLTGKESQFTISSTLPSYLAPPSTSQNANRTGWCVSMLLWTGLDCYKSERPTSSSAQCPKSCMAIGDCEKLSHLASADHPTLTNAPRTYARQLA